MVEQISTLVNIYKVLNLHMNRLCFVLCSMWLSEIKDTHQWTKSDWRTMGNKYMILIIMHWIETWCYFFSKHTKTQLNCTNTHCNKVFCKHNLPNLISSHQCASRIHSWGVQDRCRGWILKIGVPVNVQNYLGLPVILWIQRVDLILHCMFVLIPNIKCNEGLIKSWVRGIT
jgi:hypothetical protein